MEPSHVALLKSFIDLCRDKPELLHTSELAFFREYISSLGGKIPDAAKPDQHKTTTSPTPEPMQQSEDDLSPESDLDIDMTGVIEPDDASTQEMGDASVELTEEQIDEADVKRSEAIREMNQGNLEVALNLFNECVKMNATSAPTFAKRANCFIKLMRPNAAIKDCDKAISLNPDSAQAYKFRGMAHKLLGHWENAYKDLATSNKIDYSDDALEMFKEIEPKAKRIQEHNRKKERKEEEREIKRRKERVRKAREEHERAAKEEREKAKEFGGMGGGFPGGMGGMGGGMPPGAEGLFSNLFNDPELLTAMQDPEVMQAFQEVSQNPANMSKYADNPKVKRVIEKMQNKFGGMADGPDAGGLFGDGSDAPPEETGKLNTDDLD